MDSSYRQMGLDMKEAKSSNGANLGFEQKMWQAADKLRNNMDAAEYKHVVLGLIFLKYISDAFKLYEEIAKPNELGISPNVYDIYEKCIKSFLTKRGLTRTEICRKYLSIYHRALSDDVLRKEILPTLEGAGLILLAPSPDDARQIFVYPLDVSPISRHHENYQSKRNLI